MSSIVLLGILAGLRHALEADHLAAVASLAPSGGRRAALARGIAWGMGHSAALLALGGVCVILGGEVPERWARALEGAVGLVLVALGADVLRRVRRRLHAHAHRHSDGTLHSHAHPHPDPAAAAHEHRHGFSGRAFAVGTLHGLAGSGAVVMLVAAATTTPAAGLGWILLFGLGSTLGMGALSALMAAPLHGRFPRLAGLSTAVEVLLGTGTIAIGVRLVLAQVA